MAGMPGTNNAGIRVYRSFQRWKIVAHQCDDEPQRFGKNFANSRENAAH